MAKRPTLSSEQRRALQLLANTRRGATEAIMLARGFKTEMLASLVLAGFVTVVTETVKAGGGGPTIKVERYCITDDGRKAVER